MNMTSMKIKMMRKMQIEMKTQIKLNTKMGKNEDGHEEHEWTCWRRRWRIHKPSSAQLFPPLSQGSITGSHPFLMLQTDPAGHVLGGSGPLGWSLRRKCITVRLTCFKPSSAQLFPPLSQGSITGSHPFLMLQTDPILPPVNCFESASCPAENFEPHVARDSSWMKIFSFSKYDNKATGQSKHSRFLLFVQTVQVSCHRHLLQINFHDLCGDPSATPSHQFRLFRCLE